MNKSLQRGLVATTAALLSSTAAFAQGDDCSTATAISAGITPFDTSTATTSGFDGGALCAFGASTINQDIFWQFTVPTAGDWEFNTFGSSYDTKLSVHGGVGCAATCLGYNDDSGSLQSQVLLTGLNAGDMLLVQVGGFGSSFGSGQLEIVQYVDPCSTVADDSLEDNDTCATAVPLAVGSHFGLVSKASDGDFYSVTVPSGQILDVAVTDSITISGDLDLRVYDSSCNLLQDTFSNFASQSNQTAGPVDYIIEVYVDTSFNTSTCSDYDIDLTLTPDPCFGTSDDSLEDNDDCGQEVNVTSGTYNGLFVSKTDWDYYSVNVNDGDTLQIDLLFTHSLGDTDIFLYETGLCEPFANGNVGCTNSLVCGFSASDNEQIVWTNSTGSAQTYIVKVNVYPPTSTGDCNTYDMIVSGADGTGPGLGTNYCGPANPNSTGQSGTIAAAGSDVAADNDFTVTGSNLPDGQFAYFIASQTQGFVANPNQSEGNLCVLGDIARFNRAGEVGAIVGGEFSLMLPLNDVPEPPAFGAVVMAGETWNFQCWHRDTNAAGPTSNFTDALEVLFQ